MSAYVLSNGQRVYPAFVLNDADGGGIVTPPASFRLADGTQVMGVVLVDENGDIAPAPGGGQLDFVETFAGHAAGAASSITQNQIYLTRVRVHRDLDVTQMTYFVGTASGNVNLGIYTYSGGTYTLVASTASTAASGTNAAQTIALSASYTMTPGVDYALAFQADNSVITAARTSLNAGTASFKNRTTVKGGVSFGLAANNTTVSSVSSLGAAVWVAAD